MSRNPLWGSLGELTRPRLEKAGFFVHSGFTPCRLDPSVSSALPVAQREIETVVMAKICVTCVMDYLKRLIELERYMPSWNELETIEILFAMGEPQTQENIVHMDLAREEL